MNFLAMRLVQLRGNFSQAQLAKKAGVLQSTISDIENGKRNPRIDTLQKLANALDVSLNELLEDNKTKAV